MSIITTTTRRPKWQYPPAQQTPRILHLPRRPRSRRKQPPPTKLTTSIKTHQTGKLEALFDQERAFSRIGMPMVLLDSERRRERVEEENESSVMVEEEKWRFQAEMLRAECNLLRMEKEIAVKKLERRRAQVERVLRSAVQTLVSGRKEEEIQGLAEKLDKLRRRSGGKDLEVRNCSNFDKQALLLQKRLEKKFGGTSDKNCTKEIQEMAEASLSINVSSTVDGSSVSNRKCNNVQVEILRRKMDGLSKGVLLERMKEYGSMLSASNNSVANSASISKLTEIPDSSSSSTQQLDQEEKVCSGHCKAIVQRIVEQVRAETEQWTQMQEMLGQVREEMEELQASRDFWEDRALNSDYQIQCLNSAVQQWRQRALSADSKRVELQGQLSVLHGELETLKKERKSEGTRAKVSSPIPRDLPNETEKRVLICRLKENHQTNYGGSKTREVFQDGRRKEYACSKGLVAPKRFPFRDIGNSQVIGQNRSNLEENFGGCRF